MMKWIIWAAVVVAAAFGAVTLASASPDPAFRVAPATVGDVTQTVSTSGAVDHVNRADLSFGTAGTLASVVSPGDTVTAGQELATVDTTELAAAVDQAAADLAAAEDAAEESEAAEEESTSAQDALADAMGAAEAALARQVAVCTSPPPPACTAAMTETQVAQQAVAAALQELRKSSPPPPAGGSGDVAAAEAALVAAQQELAGASVVSPINGTVATVSAAVGAQVGPGDPVIVVVGPGAAVVATTVPVEQLPSLAVGQKATVTPAGGAPVDGTVTSIGALPAPDTESTAYPVTITVPEPPPTMAPGTSATAAIEVATAKDVLTVPTSAVTNGMVQVLDGEEPTMVPVRVGAVGPTRTEIVEGLTKGDQVVLADLNAPLPTDDQSQLPGTFNKIGGPGVMEMRVDK
jgi:HlyD family secretion protein